LRDVPGQGFSHGGTFEEVLVKVHEDLLEHVVGCWSPALRETKPVHDDETHQFVKGLVEDLMDGRYSQRIAEDNYLFADAVKRIILNGCVIMARWISGRQSIIGESRQQDLSALPPVSPEPFHDAVLEQALQAIDLDKSLAAALKMIRIPAKFHHLCHT
jgi:hypothetical protein